MKSLKLSVPQRVAAGGVSLLCVISLSFAPRASAENKKLDFKVHNETGYPITKMFVDKTTSDEWSDNIMTNASLATGETEEISFEPKEEEPMWDLKVEYEDGSYHEWLGLDLSKITDITLHYNKDTNTTTEEHTE